MVDRLKEYASMSYQKKKGFNLRDLAKLYRSLRNQYRHKKSSSNDPHFQTPIIKETPSQGSGRGNEDKRNMNGVGKHRYNGEGLRGDDLPTLSNKDSLKHPSKDTTTTTTTTTTTLSSCNISRTASKRSSGGASPSPSPRGSLLSRNGSLRSISRSRSRSDHKNGFPDDTLSRTSSRSSHLNANNPNIRFSNSPGILVKPPPIEMELECTLEELCFGCTQKINITRDVPTDSGQIIEEEETLSIHVKPGWKKGTKIRFEGMGKERARGADVTFVIVEKTHSLFTREGDDLELAIEIPLVQALTGCTIPIPLLGGQEMNLRIDDIIHPGYQRIIPGQGMPNPRQHGCRGNLKLSFLVNFPTHLTHEQRATLVNALGEDSR